MALFKFGLLSGVSKPGDFVRAILTQVISSGFVKTGNLGSQLLLLKLFGLEGYGIYVIAITAMDALSTIFNLNSGQAFQVRLAALAGVEKQDESGVLIIKTLFGFLILCGLLGGMIASSSFVFELTGKPSKIDAFIELMRSLGDTEISRTGVSAISRGNITETKLLEQI